MSRLQQILPSALIALVGLWVAYVSYTQSPSEAFVFPRLISTIFVVLALWTLGRAMLGLQKSGDGISVKLLRNLAPGLAVTLVYIFWAAKGLGFYTATTIAFFSLLSLYDPAPHGEVRSWVKRVIITACFMAVMYCLFALLLKVYTPREVLF